MIDFKKAGDVSKAAGLAWAFFLALAAAGTWGFPRLGVYLDASPAGAGLLALAALLPWAVPLLFFRGPSRVTAWMVSLSLVAVAVLAWGLWGFYRSHYELMDWGWAALLFFLLCLPAILGWGLTAAAWAGWDRLETLDYFLLALGLGTGLFGTVIFLGALVESRHLAFTLPVGLGCVLLLARGRAFEERLRRAAQEMRQSLSLPMDRALAGLLAGLLMVLFIPVLPPTTGWDALSTHLAIPQTWLKAGHVVNSPYLSNTLLPPLAFALNLPGILASGEQAGRMMQWLFLAGTALCAFRLAQRWKGLRAGLWAGIVFAAMPLSFILLYDGMIDYLQVFLLWSAILALLTAGPGLAGGALFGFACLVKPQALLFPGCLFLIQMLSAEQRKNWRRWLSWGLGLAIASSPWWVRNLAVTGGLFYPPLFTTGLQVHSAAVDMVMRTPSYDLRHMALFLWRVSLLPQRYGPLALLLFPLGLWAAWRRDRGVHAWVLLVFLVTFYVTGVDRWYLPLFPYAAALAGAGLAVGLEGARAWLVAPALGLQALLLCGTVLAGANLSDLWPYLKGAESGVSYRVRHVDAYRSFEVARRVMPAGGRLVLYGETRVFLLATPYVFGDPVWGCGLFDYSTMTGTVGLERACARVGATHLLFNHDKPRSDPRSPLRLIGDPLWAEFLKKHGKILFDDQGFRLYKLDYPGGPA